MWEGYHLFLQLKLIKYKSILAIKGNQTLMNVLITWMLAYAVFLEKMQRYFDNLSYTNSGASQVAWWLRTCLPVQEMQEAQVPAQGWDDPLAEEMEWVIRTPVFLPEKFHGHRSPAGCGPWGRRESGMTEHLNLYLRFLGLNYYETKHVLSHSVVSDSCDSIDCSLSGSSIIRAIY